MDQARVPGVEHGTSVKATGQGGVGSVGRHATEAFVEVREVGGAVFVIAL